MDDRLSFRQVGKDKSGKLYKGPILDGYNRISQPSIPSKYELVLAKPTDTKEGFGHRSSRFDTSVSHNPGPGHYTEELKTESPSFSHKGFLAGFVSDSKRFNAKQFKTAAPGPGAYTYVKPHSAQNPSASFVPAQHSSPIKPMPVPGPGAYEPKVPHPKPPVATTLQSKTKRADNVFTSDAPSPWHYHPDDHMIRSSSQELTRAFKQPLHARRFQVNLYDPHSQVAQEPTPGPGHYLDQSSLDTHPVNASFPRPDVDRFGQPLRPKKTRNAVPGPGAYDLSRERKERLPVSGAAFMSESKRDGHGTAKAPGPAFYRPTTVSKKKSFLLNAERKWV